MKEKKNLNWDLVILGCVGVLVVAFLCCGLASCNLLSGDVGKCLAISPFGKLELLGVDKAVVTVDGEAVTVTDPALLERIVEIARRHELIISPRCPHKPDREFAQKTQPSVRAGLLFRGMLG